MDQLWLINLNRVVRQQNKKIYSRVSDLNQNNRRITYNCLGKFKREINFEKASAGANSKKFK